MLTIVDSALAEMRAHAEETFPEECCGVLFATPNGQLVRRMTNIQNELHAADPEHERTAATAYHMHPRELFEVDRESQQPGWRIVLFYHSHPQHGAYFSPTDKAVASYDDPETGREPTYPEAAWLVLSVYDRTVRDVKAYAWDKGARDFVETPFMAAP